MSDIWYDYFEWLETIINDGNPNNLYDHHQLLWQMHNTEFRAILHNDRNRIDDAFELRNQFGKPGLIDQPIGIFEVMVALANRAEQSIMQDETKGDRTSRWFWTMIDSLGLTEYRDTNYDPKTINDILSRFICRKYAPNGAGGLFTVRPPHGDMRDVEIWDQLCLYLDDVLADEGIISIR